MSPFTTAAEALSDLSSRFSDLQNPLRQPCPGEGATVTQLDERNAARAITASRLADWAYSARAVAQAQAEADGALMRAPSPADLESLGLQCTLSNASPAALAAYQQAGAERIQAKKAHTAATSGTTWPDSVTPAELPSTVPSDPRHAPKTAGRDKNKPPSGEDDRPVGDGYGGEGVEEPTETTSDDSTAPVEQASPASSASRPLPLETPAPTVAADAANTSLSADGDPTAGARTGTLSSPTGAAGTPQPPQMAPMQPNATVTGPTGGASPQLGQTQNPTSKGSAGPRPAQTGKDDTPAPVRDTTFDALATGAGGALLGMAGGANAASVPASGSPTGPGTPSVPTTPSGAPSASPAGPAPATPPTPGQQGTGPVGAGPMARPPVPPSMGSGDTVAPTSRTPIYQAEVDPTLDPLNANPDDLDWTPPVIPTEEPKK